MQNLVPEVGIEPGLPALGTQSLNHWTARGVPKLGILCGYLCKGENKFSVNELQNIITILGYNFFQCKSMNEKNGILLEDNIA